MNWEKELRSYGTTIRVTADEGRMKETVGKAMDIFCAAEQGRMLTYREFLWEQLLWMRKRWWCLQAMLLFLLWISFPYLEHMRSAQRAIGIAASLFVILVIPELWKSRTCQLMETEAVSYYSLRQIYASRMLLFGIADIVLVTLFCGLFSAAWDMALPQLLIHFIFPMTVTACICFGTLCSKYFFSEKTAVILCMAWSMVWGSIILNEKIYASITLPLWVLLFGAAFCFFSYVVYRILYNCNSYWEVNLNGSDFG